MTRRGRSTLAKVAGLVIGGWATTLAISLTVASGRANVGLEPVRALLQTVPPPSIAFEVGSLPNDVAAGDPIFPWERDVVDGEMRWRPLLLQWRAPSFLPESRARCRELLGASRSGDACRVEYTFFVSRDAAGADRVVYAKASLPASASDPCRRYVRCRLEGYLGVELTMPESGDRDSDSWTITDRVQYSSLTDDPIELRREIDELEQRIESAQRPPDGSTDGVVDRFEWFLEHDRRQRLSILRRRLLEPSG